MSTNSCVIIKLRREDIGKEMKFDVSKLPKGVKLEGWDDSVSVGAKDKCESVKLTDEYVGIYCHWDGYPDGVGKALKQSFKTYEDVLNLIVGGACSYITKDSVSRYANREIEKWGYIKPCFGKSADEVSGNAGGCIEYTYLFNENNWKIV